MDRARYVLFSKHSMMNLVTAMRFSKDPCWHSTVNAHPEYPIHLNSRVQRMEKNRRGFPEWTWHEIHQKNHFLDNEEHVLVRALQLGLVIPPPESDEMRVV
jgi:hypothetical protein